MQTAAGRDRLTVETRTVYRIANYAALSASTRLKMTSDDHE